MAERDLGREPALREQLLPAVQIAQHSVQQARALRDARLDPPPLRRAQDERQGIENPRAIPALRVGVYIVGDAVLDDHAPREFGGAPRSLRVVLEHAVDERLPVIADAAFAVQQLVEAADVAAIMLKSRIFRLIDDCASPV
jgi:hypothetical protein